MTAGPDTTFIRSRSVTWRDTGVHVLALPTAASPATVMQLSGLGAAIWRVLDGPHSLDEIRDRIAIPGNATAVRRIVADLVAAGLLSETAGS